MNVPPIKTPDTIESFPVPLEKLSFGEVLLQFARIVPGDATRRLVPFYHFRVVLADGSDIGHINFRVGDTEHIQFYVGHIGFEILEAYRGHRYAFQACRAIAPFVRNFYNTVIITCGPDNLASIRTIERLGAKFVDEVSVPPHDPSYQRGSRSKNRYRWTP